MTVDLRNTSVLLTGGTGFLGTHLRNRFAANDVPVTLLVRPGGSVTRRDNETVVQGDVTTLEGISLNGVDHVCHLAAQTDIETAIDDPVATWEVNATGTLNLLEAVRKNDIDRFLFASTASVYGPPEYLPVDETHPMNPAEPYGASKLAADRLVHAYGQSYGLDVVVARLFNLFGPGQPRYNVVGHIIEQALDGDVVELGNLSPSRDFLYVADAVDALSTVLSDGTRGEAYNVGSGTATRIGTLAEKICELVDEEVEIVSRADRQRDDDVEIERHVADTTALRSLGWEPSVSMREGLLTTIKSFRSDGG